MNRPQSIVIITKHLDMHGLSLRQVYDYWHDQPDWIGKKRRRFVNHYWMYNRLRADGKY